MIPTVSVTITPDLAEWRWQTRRMHALMRLNVTRALHLFAATSLIRADLAGDEAAANAYRTDRRDAYFTALDAATEEDQ